jgi:hypothetical protein
MESKTREMIVDLLIRASDRPVVGPDVTAEMKLREAKAGAAA